MTRGRIITTNGQHCPSRNDAKDTDLTTLILPLEMRKDGPSFVLWYVYFWNSR